MEFQEAQEQLNAKRKPGATLNRVQRALLLPGEVRSLVEEILTEQSDYARQMASGAKRGSIGPAFSSLSEKQRSRVIRTLVPHIADEVEAAWELLALRPIQHGLSRKPFRSPRSAETLADMRAMWLLRIVVLLGDFEEGIEWVAAWAPHLTSWTGATDIGWLLAGAIDAGGQRGESVLQILQESATGDHPIGQMGHHVTQALMSCRRVDAWEFVERLLLSAQRQEGLRQAILESVDEANPEVFRRMLRLIRDENLARFSSVVRAFDTWFGLMWDGESKLDLDGVTEIVERFLDDASARTAALDGDDAEAAYLALWATAFEDIEVAVPAASTLLESASAEMRFVAVHFLMQSRWSDALRPVAKAISDPDLRVAARVLEMFQRDMTRWVDGAHLFDQLEVLHARAGKRSTTLAAPVWPRWQLKLEKTAVASAMVANASAVPTRRLLPYVRDLESHHRAAVLRQLTGQPARWERREVAQNVALSSDVRALALELAGDASPDVRKVAFDALRRTVLEADEVARLVSLLNRQAGDLRNACLTRLRMLEDAALTSCITGLLKDRDALRRLAGLELLRDAITSGRATAQLRALAEQYRADHATPSEAEQSHLEAILGAPAETRTLENALGLIDPTTRPSWATPRAHNIELETKGARATLASLTQLVLEHQLTEIDNGSGEVVTLIAGASMVPRPLSAEAPQDRIRLLPLAELWQKWFIDRPAELRDSDGLEIVRLLAAEQHQRLWSGEDVRRLDGNKAWRPGVTLVRRLLEWMLYWDKPADGLSFLLRSFETSLAAVTSKDFEEMAAWRDGHPNSYWMGTPFGEKEKPFHQRLATAEQRLAVLRLWRSLHPDDETDSATRLYSLLRWFQTRSSGFGALRITLEDFLTAYGSARIDETEFIDLLIGKWSGQPGFRLLHEVSAHAPPKELAEQPALVAALDRCRQRISEVESQRGDRETAASKAAMDLKWTGGLETLALALPALDATKFARSTSWWSGGEAKKDTLSHLVLRSTPREQDTLDAFALWAKQAKIKSDRLVELAVYAPQWARHVHHVLGWNGLESAVWWFQAHTKDDRSWQLAELKQLWAAQIAERTPLSATELTEGAVDVQWFREVHSQLGAERWRKLDQAAKYGSSAGGHKRAQLFAQAMLGGTDEAELTRRIEESRHQDSVRALGLLPLSDDATSTRDVLARYKALQEFRRGSREFGSQRQQSEGQAVTIGLANLARTAGYIDPLRLQWAMEREVVADLTDGPVVRIIQDVELRLRLTDDGYPELEVARAGRLLKSIPAALRKDPTVIELRERVTEIRRQASRVKGALEEAMCRGDTFTGPELRDLLQHPVLAPAISRLVFTTDGLLGYPAEGGRALRDHAGHLEIIGTTEPLRIAHPHDLFHRGDWPSWQRECFHNERVQPFKQVFRELYPVTEAEREQQRTRRYAGHQVNPRQAIALLGGRGWVAHPELGVHRTFHKEALTAWLYFQETFYTPAEIEGLTLELVSFTNKGDTEELWLRDIPPRVFSETMRDLDLVVSVAHQGGVDPEATASTVEMRAGLVRETCQLLGLGNVDVKNVHVVVRGEYATYTVHLGSAVAAVMPGTALYIVAVHSQHRGRLFLPFADNDPKTAEVLSKVLLLARDKEIKDPNILGQIRAAVARPHLG